MVTGSTGACTGAGGAVVMLANDSDGSRTAMRMNDNYLIRKTLFGLDMVLTPHRNQSIQSQSADQLNSPTFNHKILTIATSQRVHLFFTPTKIRFNRITLQTCHVHAPRLAVMALTVVGFQNSTSTLFCFFLNRNDMRVRRLVWAEFNEFIAVELCSSKSSASIMSSRSGQRRCACQQATFWQRCRDPSVNAWHSRARAAWPVRVSQHYHNNDESKSALKIKRSVMMISSIPGTGQASTPPCAQSQTWPAPCPSPCHRTAL